MSRRLKHFEYGGLIFTIASGFLFHFLYEWSGSNTIVALFAPVSESTWEHLKLLFFPFLFYSIFEYFLEGKNDKNFITAKIIGAIAGMIAIVALFYTYTGIIGTNYLPIDILTFVIGAAIAYLVSADLITKKPDFSFPWIVNLLILILIIFLFFFCTFYPPDIPLFLSGS